MKSSVTMKHKRTSEVFYYSIDPIDVQKVAAYWLPRPEYEESSEVKPEMASRAYLVNCPVKGQY